MKFLKRLFGKLDKMVVDTTPDYINHNPYVELVLGAKFDNYKVGRILDEVDGCRRVSWDLWEMGDKFSPRRAILDFNSNITNCETANTRIKYCATKDEFVSEMMGLSLAHEILEMKVVKSMDGSHGIIMILLCPDGDGQTNIDAGLIERLASISSVQW